MSPRNWGDEEAAQVNGGGPVVIALVFTGLWGAVIGWIAHMVIF